MLCSMRCGHADRSVKRGQFLSSACPSAADWAQASSHPFTTEVYSTDGYVVTTNGTNLVVCGNGTVEFDPSVLPEAEEMYNTTRHIGLHGELHTMCSVVRWCGTRARAGQVSQTRVARSNALVP